MLERVEELELGGGLAPEELHVLEHQDVALLPEAALEGGGGPGSDRGHELARERLRGGVDDAPAVVAAHLARHRAGEVGLAEPRARRQEQRAGPATTTARQRVGRFPRQGVAGTHHEGVEAERERRLGDLPGSPLALRGPGSPGPAFGRARRRRGLLARGGRRRRHHQLHADRRALLLARAAGDRLEIALGPLTVQLRATEQTDPLRPVPCFERSQPCVERDGGNLAVQAPHHAFPQIRRIDHVVS